MTGNSIIRQFRQPDWPQVWQLLEPVFRAGETYAFAPDIDEGQAFRVWTQAPAEAYLVCLPDGYIAGSYYIKRNQPGLGGHVCNCGYVVASQSQGKGLASLMCEHSQQVARAAGYRAMQYNLVVSSNQRAIRLWQRHGFQVVGRLPGAFRSLSLGFIDALIMYKSLVD